MSSNYRYKEADQTLVPFGKYKDQPVEVMLADSDYVEWIMAQPGLVTMIQNRHLWLFNIISVGAPKTDDTPEHNKLQAMFLNREFQYAFVEVMLGKSVYAIAQDAAREGDRLSLNAFADAITARQKMVEHEQIVRGWRQEALEKAQNAADKTLTDWRREYATKVSEIERTYQTALLDHFQAFRAEGEKNRSLHFLKTWETPEAKMDAAKKTLASSQEIFARQSASVLEEQKQLSAIESEKNKYNPLQPVKPKITLDFECGFDIKFSVWWPIKVINYNGSTSRGGIQRIKLDIHESSYRHLSGDANNRWAIELKPQMGDDFPSVLRQIKRNEASTLVIDRFEATNCTIEEVRAMFGKIKIVTLAEIEAIKARGVWPKNAECLTLHP